MPCADVFTSGVPKELTRPVCAQWSLAGQRAPRNHRLRHNRRPCPSSQSTDAAKTIRSREAPECPQ